MQVSASDSKLSLASLDPGTGGIFSVGALWNAFIAGLVIFFVVSIVEQVAASAQVRGGHLMRARWARSLWRCPASVRVPAVSVWRVQETQPMSRWPFGHVSRPTLSGPHPPDPGQRRRSGARGPAAVDVGRQDKKGVSPNVATIWCATARRAHSCSSTPPNLPNVPDKDRERRDAVRVTVAASRAGTSVASTLAGVLETAEIMGRRCRLPWHGSDE